MQLFARVFAVFALLLVPGIIHAQTWRLIGLSGQLGDDGHPTVYCWTNFAGSLTSDVFGGIYGIDINGAGDLLFIADRDGGNKMHSISIPGAVVTELVPSSGSYGSIVELVVDKVNGNIYFPDITGAGSIKRMTYPGLVIDTISTGTTAFGLGIDSAADILYVSGINNGSVYYITNASGATPGPLTLLAGNGVNAGYVEGSLAAARFDAPMGIAVSGTGDSAILYVGDRDNNAIRKIDRSVVGNEVSTVAGGTGRNCNPGSVSGPHGCFLGPDGNLYVPGQESYTIMKVELPSGTVTHIGGTCGSAGAAEGCGSVALNGNISQVCVDSAGNIYTCDRGGINGADRARVSKGTLTTLESFTFPDNTWFQINEANGAATKLFTGTFVPDSHSIGYCPVDGRAYHTGGSEAYRNDPCRTGQPQYLQPTPVHGLAFQDNQYMESVNLGLQAVTPIYNANSCPNPDTNTFDCLEENGANPPYGTGFQLPCWGLPAPFPSWVMPQYRRQAIQLSGYQETGSNEVSSIRGMAWSTSSNLFYISSDGGIFKMTKDGDCTFLARPAFTNDTVTGHLDREKGIAFVNVGGVTKLLIGHRDANFLMEVDPATGANIGEIALDYTGGDGILGLAQHPVTGVLYGIGHTGETTARELITIDPVTGTTTVVGNMAMHMSSIAFVPDIVITSISDNAGTLTVTWSGAAGPTFSLQTTDSLTPPVTWTPLASGLTGPSTTTSITNSLGFFRITKP